jgi:hypothetical protein
MWNSCYSLVKRITIILYTRISVQNGHQNTEGSHFITYVGGYETLLLSLMTEHRTERRLQVLPEQCVFLHNGEVYKF